MLVMGVGLPVVVVFMMVMVSGTWPQVTEYRKKGVGICGDDLDHFDAVADTLCAIQCNRKEECAGFSFLDHRDNGSGLGGHCHLHQQLSSPDGSPHTTCYAPVIPQTTTTATTTPPPTTTTTTAQNVPPTTTTIQDDPIATTTTQNDPTTTTQDALSITTTTQNDLTTTSSSSSTPQGPPSAATTTTTEPTASTAFDLATTSSKNVDLGMKCNSDSPVIGIFVKQDLLGPGTYLVCMAAPSELPFTVDNPTASCSLPMNCMNQDCPSGSLVIGFDGIFSKKGPCGALSSSTVTLDTSDCYIVTADTQPRPTIGDSWTSWMMCDGDYINFYVVTGVLITQIESGSYSYTLTTITCCRVKLI